MGYASDAREEHAHAQATTSPSIMKTSVHRLSFGIGGISELHAKDKDTSRCAPRGDAISRGDRARATRLRFAATFFPSHFFLPLKS
jgi:hypothetical protein